MYVNSDFLITLIYINMYKFRFFNYRKHIFSKYNKSIYIN